MGVLESVGEESGEEGEEWSAEWIVERVGGGCRCEVCRERLLGVCVVGMLSVARIFLW